MNHFRHLPRITVLLVCCVMFSTQSRALDHPAGMHPQAQLDFVKQQIKTKKQPYLNAFNQLMVRADSALLINQHAIEDFAIPGFYVKKEEHRQRSLALQVDGFSAYSCALAWQLTGKSKYADKSIYFLNAWASINKKYSENDGPLVMSYSGTTMLMAAELMRNYKKWTPSQQHVFAGWVRNVVNKASHKIRDGKNNWADWGRLSSLLADCYLDDKADIQTVSSMIKADLFNKIAPDGHMVEEVKREGNSIWYTYFSLAPLTASCWVIYNTTGENLFKLEQGGTSIKKALDYLLYYNAHPDEWTWFKNPATGNVNTAVGFWPANLMEAMRNVYHDDKYDAYVAPYRPIMYTRHDYAWTYPTLFPLSLDNYKDQK
ncbi:alginate lyase [Mucilaginibacter yixingensis]|uniref:Alginate lyase n=2 Tax=Mucilaginibacter yixingensis TaxID=1295612 RepID=A0A2T5JAI9_9SPHI|nr:alginate lyase [Mucilaginibacter yixingensis]